MKPWQKGLIGLGTLGGLGAGGALVYDKYQDNQQEEAQAAKLEAEEKEKAAQEKAAQEAIAQETLKKTIKTLQRQVDRVESEKEKSAEAQKEATIVYVPGTVQGDIDNGLAIPGQEAWCKSNNKINGEPVSGTVNAYAVKEGENGTTIVQLCGNDGKGVKKVSDVSCEAAPKKTNFSYSCQVRKENGEEYNDWYIQRKENDDTNGRVYQLADSGSTDNRDEAVSVLDATDLTAVCSTNNNGTTCVSSEGWEYRVGTLTRGFVGYSAPGQGSKAPSLEKRVGNLEERVGDGEVRDQLHEAVLTNHAAKLKAQQDREARNALILKELQEGGFFTPPLSPGDAAANAEAEHQKRMKR